MEDKFSWGVSTAAYQIEGAHNIHGKGASIWDVFANTPGKTHGNQHANVSCDFYHHYAQDIALMAQMNISNFRFSLSWSRIIPGGTGAVNPDGIDFYNKVIDFCLDLGIEPWVTLYHWDLPYSLELKGGWTNREIINWFTVYVQLCLKLFGDRVKHWMILNEPMVFTGAGYFMGIHAPGRKGLTSFLAAAHHAALCQAEGTRAARAIRSDATIGTTFSCSLIEPYTSSDNDQYAATKLDALANRMFVEPLVGKSYPVKDFKLLNRLENFVKDGDEAKLAANVDFIGIQNYTREKVTHSYMVPLLWAKVVKASKRSVDHTLMDWEVYPPAIHSMLHQFSSYGKPLIVTENGAAFNDIILNNAVHDHQRQQYLQMHIEQVLKAKQEGVDVRGYFVWTLLDNFEWAEGYRPRFGLVHVDFKTQKRVIKYSGHWYANFLQSHGESALQLSRTA
ncbi:GH1 family beta-glucosidase [Aridibaculum aurantiacum]|uniref:GH1 family beta-glucosidase n=1 Tax=Aridibaculum aurantiacum TaxID=2810307 RepID=UPI001A975262|nr:GH1 family beta-glucosidase [Aridibaculum aurantiacum]